jgi:DNA-binding response OmpR family regulator
MISQFSDSGCEGSESDEEPAVGRARTRARAAGARAERGNVLVVDDEPNVRLLFRATLEAAGYRIAEASSGSGVLARLTRFPADVILLDLQMPEIGGMDVLRLLRDHGYEMPVVIVTAHGSIPDAVEAMRLGAMDFVAKPLTSEALRGEVAAVLARQEEPPHVTAEGQYAANLSRAKRAFTRRNFDEAEVFLRQAVGLVPGSAEAHNLMGVLHEVRGEPLAYIEYDAALKSDPDYEPAQHNMARFYRRIYSGREDIPPDTGID